MPVPAQVGRVYDGGRINMLTFPFQLLWRQLRRESCGCFLFWAYFALTFGKAAGTGTYGIVDAVSDWMSEACKIISL